ncbi:MAG TPA: hypothetical protein PK299_14170, partial [Anaerolineales bacterium]|nr:hypothetical protein [Anaerolineales bacterium]
VNKPINSLYSSSALEHYGDVSSLAGLLVAPNQAEQLRFFFILATSYAIAFPKKLYLGHCHFCLPN